MEDRKPRSGNTKRRRKMEKRCTFEKTQMRKHEMKTEKWRITHAGKNPDQEARGKPKKNRFPETPHQNPSKGVRTGKAITKPSGKTATQTSKTPSWIQRILSEISWWKENPGKSLVKTRGRSSEGGLTRAKVPAFSPISVWRDRWNRSKKITRKTELSPISASFERELERQDVLIRTIKRPSHAAMHVPTHVQWTPPALTVGPTLYCIGQNKSSFTQIESRQWHKI